MKGKVEKERSVLGDKVVTPYIFGHRGASGKYPDNTLLAFEKALELGADGIETDAYVTKDGHVILFHDRKVTITRNNGTVEQKPVAKCTLEMIKKIALEEDQRIPKFTEVLEWAENNHQWKGPRGLPLRISIDLQHCRVIEPIVHLIEEYGATPYIDLCASWSPNFSKIRKLSPKIPIVASNTAKTSWHFRRYKDLRIKAFNVKFADIKQIDVQNIKKENFLLYIWDLHDKERLEASVQYSPDAIYTNFPGLARRLLPQ